MGPGKLCLQRWHQRTGQHDHPILVALAAAHDDHLPVKVNVLHAQALAFCQPHARAIQEPGQQAFDAVQQRQNGLYFVLGQDDGNALALWRAADALKPRQIQAQHLFVQKQQRVERLPVGRGGYLPIVGEHGEKCLDLRPAHVAGMPHPAFAATPTDEKARPVEVSFFSLQAIVKISNPFAQLVQQADGMESRGGDFVRFNIPVRLYSILAQYYVSKQLFRIL